MPRIQDDIIEKFLEELTKTEGFSVQRIEQLRALFQGGKKPKAPDLVKILSAEEQEQLS